MGAEIIREDDHAPVLVATGHARSLNRNPNEIDDDVRCDPIAFYQLPITRKNSETDDSVSFRLLLAPTAAIGVVSNAVTFVMIHWAAHAIMIITAAGTIFFSSVPFQYELASKKQCGRPNNGRKKKSRENVCEQSK